MNILNLQGDREAKKDQRARRLSRITVTVVRDDGTELVFDGDEESQKRLDRYSRRLAANGYPGGPWTLANNESVEVTVEEMEQALDLAMEEQGRIWALYTQKG